MERISKYMLISKQAVDFRTDEQICKDLFLWQ